MTTNTKVPNLSATTHAPNPSATHVSWSERLLAGDGSAGLAHEGRRLAVAVGLASTFGLALGLRAGGLSIAWHALGVSLGILGVCALAVPALAILLALADAPVDALGLSRATSRAAANAGLVLAGLAPGAALFAVTVEDAITVMLVGASGLSLAGAIGMGAFVRELGPRLAAEGARPGLLSKLALPAFLLFSAVLGARIWWITLPLVRGAS
ncbi:MAG: hypothetical protein HYV09_33140 [Deltaproteobacteria bacterium]|nr:hypothetical protein [Deltaproteobacteria bacterium]